MSTNAKTGQKTAKKAGCRCVNVISNDWADAFLDPQPEVCPRDSEAPSARDKRAHDLMSKGWTQRRIAAKLGCSQPTVQRAIHRYRLWFGTTLPEDRGEITGFARYRIAVEEHRIFLEHQKQLAMQEWRRSRQSARKPGGQKGAETQTGQHRQKRNANVSHFNAATRLSLQLTMLQAGYLGVHRLACDQALDIDGLDRWDRAVKSRDRVIEELTREVAELKAKLAGGVGFPPAQQSTPHAPREDVISRSEMGTIRESTSVENNPGVNQNPPSAEVATSAQPVVCEQAIDSAAAILHAPEFVNQEAASGGDPRSAVSTGPQTEPSSAESPEPEKQFRWEDEYRQEALDYHCLRQGLKPASIAQATGIPDPKSMSPRMWIERGYPYQIYIDWSVKCTRKNPLDTGERITLHWPTVIGKIF